VVSSSFVKTRWLLLVAPRTNVTYRTCMYQLFFVFSIGLYKLITKSNYEGPHIISCFLYSFLDTILVRHQKEDIMIPAQLRQRSKQQRHLKTAWFLLLLSLTPTLTSGLFDNSLRAWGTKHTLILPTKERGSDFDAIKLPLDDAASIASSHLEDTSGVRVYSKPKQAVKVVAKKGVTHAPKIIIIGGPASGKGTQCEHISSIYGVVHLSTGDLLRKAVKDGSHVGCIAEKYMSKGELVPDEVIIQIVSERLQQNDCRQRGWLLDGFPRTKAQAEHLTRMGIKADVTLLLNVSDSELIQRVVGRRTDPVTGKIYHLKFSPPPHEVIDRVEQRSDDTIEKMHRRLEQFHENLSQVRSYLHSSIVELDGSGSPDVVAGRVAEALSSKVDHIEINA
jgi:adenylate kinase